LPKGVFTVPLNILSPSIFQPSPRDSRSEVQTDRDPPAVAAEDRGLREQTECDREFLEAACRLSTVIKAAVRLLFRLEYAIEKRLRGAALR
jgi:hypothetical protein